MPIFVRPRSHWTYALLGFCLCATAAWSAEHDAAPQAEAAAPVKPRAAAKAATEKSAEDVEPAARPDPTQDPIDRLRERLAQKLGAVKAPGVDSGNVMRVVSKPSVGAGYESDVITTPSGAHGSAGKRSSHARPVMSGVAPGQARWDYVGDSGPSSWAQLKPEFSRCASGNRQSPIDIRDGIRVDLDPVAFDYKASSFKVVDNGHTVEVILGAGNSIELGGRRYDLVRLDFHRPSEERIDGKQFDMAVHLVHRDLEGHLAVIAVLLNRGNALQAVQTVWNNLPLEKGDEVSAQTLLDPSEMLPTDRSYYTYMGSLTTPPCSEGVLWLVMKKPIPVSAEQIGIFAHLYPMNARPIQAASGRLIKESN